MKPGCPKKRPTHPPTGSRLRGSTLYLEAVTVHSSERESTRVAEHCRPVALVCDAVRVRGTVLHRQTEQVWAKAR
jgi:hypothetical protein